MTIDPGPTPAPESKPWWQSKVIIGTAVTMICSVLKVTGKDIDPALQGSIIDALLLLGQLGGGIIAIVGRFTASKSLT